MIAILLYILMLLVPGYLIRSTLLRKSHFTALEIPIITITCGVLLLIGNTFLLGGMYLVPFIFNTLTGSYVYQLSYFWALTIIETFALFFVGRKTIKDTLKEDASKLRIPTSSITPIIVGITCLAIVAIPPLSLMYQNNMPSTSLVFAYNGMATRLIYDGYITNVGYNYGTVTATDHPYIGYSYFSATSYLILDMNDPDYIMFMTALTLIASFLYLMLTYRQMLSPYYAIAGATLTLWMKLFLYKLSTFRTEALAICFIFMGSWLAIKGYKEKDNRLLCLGGITTGLAATMNASNIVVGVGIIAAFILTSMILEDHSRDAVKRTAFVSIITLATVASVFLFSLGNIPIMGSLSDSSEIDAGAAFIEAMDGSAERSIQAAMPGYVYRDVSVYFDIITFLCIVGLIILVHRPNLRNNLIFVTLLGAVLVGVSFFFYFRYDTLTPERLGFKRIFPYMYIPLTLIPVIILEKTNNLKIKNVDLTRILKIAVYLGILYLVISTNYSYMQGNYNVFVSRESFNSLTFLKENVPRNTSIILTNEWTNGGIGGATGLRVLNDGDAPYLRADAVERINTVIAGSVEFFKNPVANIDYLNRYNITHVITTDNGQLKGKKLASVSEASLIKAGLVKIYDENGIKIYEYKKPSPS